MPGWAPKGFHGRGLGLTIPPVPNPRGLLLAEGEDIGTVGAGAGVAVVCGDEGVPVDREGKAEVVLSTSSSLSMPLPFSILVLSLPSTADEAAAAGSAGEAGACTVSFFTTPSRWPLLLARFASKITSGTAPCSISVCCFSLFVCCMDKQSAAKRAWSSSASDVGKIRRTQTYWQELELSYSL